VVRAAERAARRDSHGARLSFAMETSQSKDARRTGSASSVVAADDERRE
jgi:hypothetical protein